MMYKDSKLKQVGSQDFTALPAEENARYLNRNGKPYHAVGPAV